MSHLLQIHDALANVPVGGVLQGSGSHALLPPLTKLIGKRAANRLMRHVGVPGIQRMSTRELAVLAQVSAHGANVVAAARDLHFALMELAFPRVHEAENIVAALPTGLRFLEFEVLLGCALSANLELGAIVLLGKGGALSTSVTPRDVFRPMVRMGAVAFALVHCHPSGDPSPSQSDLEFTRAVDEMGAILGLELVDHIIVASGGTTSLRELGHVGVKA